jgi:hypothetical protein
MALVDAALTDHALAQMHRRRITEEEVRTILFSPLKSEDVRPGRVVVQGLLDEKHLLRVFIDTDRTPNEIVTVYKTSKLAKYLGET